MGAASGDRERLVRLIARRGIADAEVLRAMGEVPREAFLPPALHEFAYDDTPLPIAEGQTISQPYIVAMMAEAADIGPRDRVLEVRDAGAKGFQTLPARECSEPVPLQMVQTQRMLAVRRGVHGSGVDEPFLEGRRDGRADRHRNRAGHLALQPERLRQRAVVRIGPHGLLGPGAVGSMATEQHRQIRARRDDSHPLQPNSRATRAFAALAAQGPDLPACLGPAPAGRAQRTHGNDRPYGGRAMVVAAGPGAGRRERRTRESAPAARRRRFDRVEQDIERLQEGAELGPGHSWSGTGRRGDVRLECRGLERGIE